MNKKIMIKLMIMTVLVSPSLGMDEECSVRNTETPMSLNFDQEISTDIVTDRISETLSSSKTTKDWDTENRYVYKYYNIHSIDAVAFPLIYASQYSTKAACINIALHMTALCEPVFQNWRGVDWHCFGKLGDGSYRVEKRYCHLIRTLSALGTCLRGSPLFRYLDTALENFLPLSRLFNYVDFTVSGLMFIVYAFNYAGSYKLDNWYRHHFRFVR